MGFQERFKKQDYYIIGYSELDTLLAEAFPQVGWGHGDFAATKEVGNDTWVVLTVRNQEPDSWDAKELAELLSGESKGGYGAADLLMDELCRRGLIEPGDYLVEVSW